MDPGCRPGTGAQDYLDGVAEAVELLEAVLQQRRAVDGREAVGPKPVVRVRLLPELLAVGGHDRLEHPRPVLERDQERRVPVMRTTGSVMSVLAKSSGFSRLFLGSLFCFAIDLLSSRYHEKRSLFNVLPGCMFECNRHAAGSGKSGSTTHDTARRRLSSVAQPEQGPDAGVRRVHEGQRETEVRAMDG